jgi:hypothetical protein
MILLLERNIEAPCSPPLADSKCKELIYSASKTWSLGPVHDPVSRGSEFNGFAGIGANTFGVLEYWSTGVLAKTKARI